MDKGTCLHCLKTFHVSSKKRHMKRAHGIIMERNCKRSLIFCPLCVNDGRREGMENCFVLIKHLQGGHDVVIEEERLTFPNHEDFEKWRKLEHRNVDYAKTRIKYRNDTKGIKVLAVKEGRKKEEALK